MQPGTPRFSEGETTNHLNIDTFGRYLIIFGRFFRGLSLRADSGPGGANFYFFVPSLVLPKITARVGSRSSTAEKKVVRRHGVRSLIVYSIPECKEMSDQTARSERCQRWLPIQLPSVGRVLSLRPLRSCAARSCTMCWTCGVCVHRAYTVTDL